MQAIHRSRSGFEQLSQLSESTEHLFADHLELDMSQVSAFEGNMAAPLGVVLGHVMDEFNSVEVVAIPSHVKRILRKNRFLTHFRYSLLDDVHGTTMPYRRLRLTDEGSFEDYVQLQLTDKGIPDMSEMASQRFKQKVFEVYQNAVTHSESDIGVFVCGQVFPSDNRVDFTIADGGMGIRDSVRRYFETDRISSIAALKWALEPNHTTKRGRHPGGLGLQFLRSFSALNKGKIRIVSRFAFYEFDCGKQAFHKLQHDFPGTAVTIQINTADTGKYILPAEITSEEP